jgi:MFS transporter, DHA1 family, tetracycline resistance protein
MHACMRMVCMILLFLAYIASNNHHHMSTLHRSGILVLGITLSTTSPLILLLMQLNPTMSPFWYYSFGALQGLVNWIAVALSALSDVMPPRWRAPSFGLLLAGFSLGFALAPGLALWLGHVRVTMVSVGMVVLGLFVIIVLFPETLTPESAAKARQLRVDQFAEMPERNRVLWTLYRPLWELSILNRNRLFRLLSSLAFFSGLVAAGDRSLILYYVQERLGFNDKDIALMFLTMGLLGILVQGVLLKIINDILGERGVVALCFVLGSVYNFLYGIAHNKATIFVAVAISAFVGMAFPTISAIKSNNVVSAATGTYRMMLIGDIHPVH